MIHKIVIENFYSIADRQELDFRIPDNVPDLPCFRPSRADPKTRLPVAIGIFGPNASGKSTVLRAVVAAATFAQQSFILPVNGHIPLFQSYMRKDWWERPTIIIVEFDGQLTPEDSPALFRYELHIAYIKDITGYAVAKTVSYEGLFYAPKGKLKKLFERKEQEFSFGREFDISDNDPRVKSIRPNASVISTLAQLNHKLCLDFAATISGIQTNIAGFDKVPVHANQFLFFYKSNPEIFEKLNRELGRLDVGLEEMIIDEKPSSGLYAVFRHTGLDAFIFMNEESAGTRRFIEIFPRLQYILETGSLAFIDELDADLHPLLIPELFRWFGDPERNPHGAQLFFTAHNPVLLDELEKEQVLLTQKPSGKPTEIYGAWDIKGLRREPSLMKKYLSGELGAIPYIG